MTWIVVAAVVLLLVVAGYRLAAGAPYAKIFAAPHLAELAQKLDKAKAAALAELAEGGTADEDAAKAIERGAAFVTSAGIGMMYAIAKKDDAFEHHLSMSWSRGAFAKSGAATVLAFVRKVLGFDGAACTVEAADRGVFHLVASMTPAQHASFAERTAAPPDERASTRLLAESLASPERGEMLALLAKN